MIPVRTGTCGRYRFPQVPILARSVAVLLMATLLGGCQVLQSWLPANPTPQASLPTSAATPLPAETPASTPFAGSEEKQTLTIWLPPQFDPNNGTEAGNLLRERLDTFARENGLSLNVRIKAENGPAGLLEALEITGVAAPDALPALIALPRTQMETAALKGLIYPLTELTNELEENDWYPYAAELATVQGTPFGLPFAGDALVLLYRPTRLPVPAQDWQGILYTNQTLLLPAGDPQALFTLALYRAAGGSLEDENGRPMLDENALTGVMELYQHGTQLNSFPAWLAQLTSDSLTWQAYREQRANWIVTWASNYLSELPADTNIVQLPAFTGQVSIADGWVWCLTDPQVDRRALSVKLAETLVTSEYLADWTEAAGYLPTRPSALATWTTLSLSAPLQDILINARLRPDNEVVDNLGPVLQEAILQVLEKHTDAATAAKQAAEKISLPNNP